MKTIGIVGGVGPYPGLDLAKKIFDKCSVFLHLGSSCIAAPRPLTIAKEISNIGMGFLRQFLALDVSHGAVKYPIVVPCTDDNWHGDRMPHEQCLLL